MWGHDAELFSRPCLDVCCISVGLVTFWLVCPSLIGSYIIWIILKWEADLYKSMLCSEQANAVVLWGQRLSPLMLLLYSSFVLLVSPLSLVLWPLSPPSCSCCCSCFLTQQHEEPSDFISMPLLQFQSAISNELNICEMYGLTRLDFCHWRLKHRCVSWG